VLPGQTVTCNAGGSRAAPGKFITSWHWTMGDGNSKSGVQVQHSYTAPATYTVQLTVTDNVGSHSSVTTQVTVGQPAAGLPVADFAASPATAPVGTFVNFDASGSSAATGATIASYEWNFGDNIDVLYCPANLGANTESQCTATSPPNARHRFSTAQTFSVRLVVVDSLGRRSAAVVKQVTITP
jgi:PKD repeat protein